MINLKPILFQKNYFIFFIALEIIITVSLIFSWSLVLWSNFYVRADLWTPLNVILLLATSTLSALNITLSVYFLRRNREKKSLGFLSAIPAFFTTVCSGCAPLLLSFWSTTASLWFSYFVKLRFYLIIFIILILLLSFWRLISADECSGSKCKTAG